MYSHQRAYRIATKFGGRSHRGIGKIPFTVHLINTQRRRRKGKTKKTTNGALLNAAHAVGRLMAEIHAIVHAMHVCLVRSVCQYVEYNRLLVVYQGRSTKARRRRFVMAWHSALQSASFTFSGGDDESADATSTCYRCINCGTRNS